MDRPHDALPPNAATTPGPHEELEALRAELADARRALALRDEAIQARDDFLTIAAHELRNPLHTLSLQLTLLQRAAARHGAGELVEHAERAMRSSRLFSRRASVLLDIGRLNRGLFHLDLTEVDVAALVDEVVAQHREDADFQGIEVRPCVERSRPCRWDRQAISQALSNLLGNAIKYGEGRPVDLHVDDDGPDAVRISVHDRGPGISVADRERVFERFERLLRDRPRAEGFGLGLWLTRRIVVAHGGSIRIDSEPGRGSSFVITLPAEAADRPLPSEPDPDHDHP